MAYTLAPVFNHGALTALAVTIRLRGDPDGKTRVAFVDEWAGDHALWRWRRDLHVDGARQVRDLGKGAVEIRAAAGAPLTVRYRIVSAYDHDPTVNDSKQPQPVIRPDWFFAVGESVFAIPDGREHAPATFAWTGAPKSFGFASDLEHLGGPGRTASRPGTVDDVLESIAIGGKDLHLTTTRVDGAPVRVAAIGRYDFSLKDFDAEVLKVLASERVFWGDRGEPFLVAMSPVVTTPAQLSYSGAGRSDAFALWAPNNVSLPVFRGLIAHEYFHTWNPARLGGMREQARESVGYWFTEGFTDYYARKLMLRAGLFTPKDFAADWNRTLRAYTASPLKAAPNDRIAADFWTNQDAQKMPYYRGAMFAAVLDLKARARGHSLDDVMRRIRREAAQDGKKVPADLRLQPAYKTEVGVDIQPLIDRHMTAGEPLVLPADVFGPCVTVEARTLPVFERGWDPVATRAAGDVIAGLNPDSAAYAAGLRDGMKVVAFVEGEPGDATVAYVLRVAEPDGKSRLIRFFPAGKRTFEQQVVVPTATAATGFACAP